MVSQTWVTHGNIFKIDYGMRYIYIYTYLYTHKHIYWLPLCRSPSPGFTKNTYGSVSDFSGQVYSCKPYSMVTNNQLSFLLILLYCTLIWLPKPVADQHSLSQNWHDLPDGCCWFFMLQTLYRFHRWPSSKMINLPSSAPSV